MFFFIGKVVLLFIIYITGVRLLGKTALAQLTPHDFAAIFFLAYLLFGSINVDGIGQGLVGVITVITTHFLMSRLTLFNHLSKYIIGEPIFLIKDGEILYKNLKRSRYTLTELLSSVRSAGFFDLNAINYAILEPNGNISVLPKKEMATVTHHDLNIDSDDHGLPLPVVIDGEIQHTYLSSIQKDETWLKKQLYVHGYSQLKNIILATVKDKDLTLKVYTQK